MTRFTPNQGHETGTGDPDPAAGSPGPSPIATRLLLVGGGFLASWGALVTLALAAILIIQGPGPGGYVPFFLGAVVIGLFPTGFGVGLFLLGRQRRRQTRITPGRE